MRGVQRSLSKIVHMEEGEPGDEARCLKALFSKFLFCLSSLYPVLPPKGGRGRGAEHPFLP